MLKRLSDWLSSWVTTLDIMVHDRQLYRELRDMRFDEADFMEVEMFTVAPAEYDTLVEAIHSAPVVLPNLAKLLTDVKEWEEDPDA